MFCSFEKKGEKEVEKFVRLANQSRRHSAAPRPRKNEEKIGEKNSKIGKLHDVVEDAYFKSLTE